MRASKKRTGKRTRAKRANPVWELHLYVTDTSPRSVLATENLRSFCQQHLSGCHRITVIDIGKQPAMAREHEILATPTLVRVLPEPPKMVIGSLSDTARVLRALDLAEVPKKITSVLSPTASQVGHA